MDRILYSPKEGTTGFWGLRDVPTQPNEDDYKRHRAPGLNDFIRAESDYMKALESCKKNKLELFIVNSDLTWIMEPHLKPGDIFDLPEGYHFEEGVYGTFLRLVKTETKEETGYCAYPDDCQWPLGCHKSCKPQSEESQECLLRQIFNITGVDDLYTLHYQKILSQFTIQRKKQ